MGDFNYQYRQHNEAVVARDGDVILKRHTQPKNIAASERVVLVFMLCSNYKRLVRPTLRPKPSGQIIKKTLDEDKIKPAVEFARNFTKMRRLRKAQLCVKS